MTGKFSYGTGRLPSLVDGGTLRRNFQEHLDDVPPPPIDGNAWGVNIGPKPVKDERPASGLRLISLYAASSKLCQMETYREQTLKLADDLDANLGGCPCSSH